jgi:hypothetical protein
LRPLPCTSSYSDSTLVLGLYLALPIYIKMYLKAKVELWKLKYFTMQKYNLEKNPLKETKILQDIITL